MYPKDILHTELLVAGFFGRFCVFLFVCFSVWPLDGEDGSSGLYQLEES